MPKSLALTAVVIGSLSLEGCMTHGALVSRTEQHGQPASPLTASCRQRCESQALAGGDDLTACIASCPDVVFLEDAVCAPAHRSLCVPDSRFSGRKTGAVVLATVATAVLIVATFVGFAYMVASGIPPATHQ